MKNKNDANEILNKYLYNSKTKKKALKKIIKGLDSTNKKTNKN